METLNEKINRQLRDQKMMLIGQNQSIIEQTRKISIPFYRQRGDVKRASVLENDIKRRELEIANLKKQLKVA